MSSATRGKKVCRECQLGNVPQITGSGKVEHWIVKSIFPARITIKECKEPERWLTPAAEGAKS